MYTTYMIFYYYYSLHLFSYLIFLFFSKKMVGFWTMGDIFKTGYFIVREAPPQFWICGMLQVSIDISIFLQVYIYRNLSTKSKL